MTNRLSLIISSFFILMSTVETAAVNHRVGAYQYRIISQSDGLSNNKVRSVAKDKYGTCWVGTQKGLNRIVENKIISYSDNEMFRNKEIVFVVRDSIDQIWVATRAGLYLYDYFSDTFENKLVDNHNVIATAYGYASDGIIFNTSDGIIKFRYKDKSLKLLQYRISYTTVYSSFKVVDDSTVLVAVNGDAVYKLNLNANKLTPFVAFEPSYNVKDIFIDSQSRVWIAIYNKGVFCHSLATGTLLCRYTKENSALSHNTILDIEEFDNQLWMATDGGGVNIMDVATGLIYNFSDHIAHDIVSEIGSILSIYRDKATDDIWFGSIRHGAICVKKSNIQSFSGNDFGPEYGGINSSIIQCICEDYDGNIWFGTDGGGLNMFDVQSGAFHNVKAAYRLKVVAIENIDADWLLISVYNRGIYRFNKRTEAMYNVPIVDARTNEYIIGRDMIIDLAKYRDDMIYVMANDLYTYETESNRIIKHDSSGINSLNAFAAVYIDDSVSIIHNYYDIYLVNNHTNIARLIYHSKTGDIISARRHEDKLWLNKNYRLVVLDLKSGECKERDFAYNNAVLSLETDGRNLWVATYDKLIRVDFDDLSKYTIFSGSDGVAGNNFFGDISIVSHTGALYFGGNAGLCVMWDSNATSETPHSDVLLYSVKVDGECTKYDMDYSGNPYVSIPWQYQSMEFCICTQGGSVFRSNKYRYTINEKSKRTVIYSDNSLSLPILAPGTYNIDIAYLDSGDKWIESERAVTINVVPPWWKSTIFIIIIYTLLLGGALAVVYYYFRRKKQHVIDIFRQRKQELSDNKIKFLINVSHELRTPLTLIYAPLKRMLENNQLGEENRGELTRIFSQSKYMIRLVNMVLDTRKLEEGYEQLAVGRYDFNEWVKEVGDEFRIEYEHKNISLIYNLDPKVEMLNFDNGKCRIALSNLLMNAYKYSDSNTAVTVATELRGASVRLSVIDQGIGLKGVNVKSLFNRFVQAHDKSKGSGLGLAYTKLLVEIHPGAKISAYTNEGVGSTFYFEIPTNIECRTMNINNLTNLDTSLDIHTPTFELDRDYDTSQTTLLIVEDEPEMLEFIHSSMKEYFKSVFVAHNGVEALEITRAESPDVIISDVMMPEMNGYELCRKIKNDIKISHIPVILLTAQADIDNRTAGYKSGADIFLPKPFDTQILLAAVRNLMYNRELVKQRYKSNFGEVSVSDTTFSDADEQFMLKLNQYINDNIGNDSLNVQSILDHMCMGRATFYKKLKVLTDIGAMEYVTNLRMIMAAQKLENSDASISEIASSVGYNDNQYFSKAFKQYFEMSPSSYRKEKKNRVES